MSIDPKTLRRQIDECRDLLNQLPQWMREVLSSQLQTPTPQERIAELERQRDAWEEEAKRYCANVEYWKDRTEKAEQQLAQVLGLLEVAKCPNRCISGVLPRTNLCETGDVDQCQWCAMRDAAIGKREPGSSE